MRLHLVLRGTRSAFRARRWLLDRERDHFLVGHADTCSIGIGHWNCRGEA
jgi:hypothetical protein